MNRLITTILALSLAMASIAQDIIVTMTPTQPILPPQVLLYLSQPNQYFNVSLMNTTNEPKEVYLGMSIEQLMPDMSISIRVGANKQPERPFVVPANGTYQLTMVDMKKMFDHVPSSDIQATPGLFDNYEYGAFGLLPEGEYEAQIIAYQWNPSLRTPVALSTSTGGRCTFTICYKAQAPQFLTPMVANMFDINQIAELDPTLPQFTWTAPMISCNPLASNFQYTIKIVEMLPTQTPTEAMERNAAVYMSPSPLISPLCILPQTIANKLDPNLTYVAQVTATTSNLQSSYLNFAMIENDGKSTYRLFKVKKKKAEEKAEEVKTPEVETPEEKEAEKEEPEDDDYDISLTGKNKWLVDSTMLYTFRNPEITSPRFTTDEKRRTKVYQDLYLKWNAVWYVGGLGARPDTLKMKYKVNLYKADDLIEDYNEIEEYCKANKPVLVRETEEIKDTIRYAEIASEVSAGQYLYLRIDPICLNEDSIAYVDSLCNKLNWALIDPPTKKYFECSNSVVIDDTLPTDKKASDLKGTVVSIGEYNLTLDELDEIKGQKGYFKGKGHIEWRPLGAKVMVAVKFDTIALNKDGIVYAGEVNTYPRPEMKNSEVVNEIFTDLGIDDWASDLGLPYGTKLDKYSKEAAQKVADKVNISEYYKYVKTGKGIWDDITAGEIKDLYLPLQVPKEVNKSPVDIQIYSATFTPQWAKMNIIGEFTLPESEYIKDNILIFAAPRLCISPERLIPESGTLTLMKDFTVVDPKSQFEFSFNAPDDLQAPTKGCFVSWHADAFEVLDIDVSMLIPNIKKVDAKGNKTEEMPSLNFHVSIGGWDDWFAEGSMDPFTSDDLDGWIFQPGTIGYDHSIHRSANNFSGLPEDYDREKAGMSAEGSDTQWQGLFIEDMGIVFPKMLKVSDEEKNWEGHLKLKAEKILIDDSGISLNFGMKPVLELGTGKAGGWGLSMEEIMLKVTQNTFKKCWFKGKIETPLEGLIGYECDIIAQGTKEGRKAGEEGFVYVFSTQQVEGLKFDFWLAELDLDKDQTYFLLEAETFKNKEDEVRVELCMGGKMSITIGRDWLRNKNKAGAFLDAHIPDLHITGMRIANCPRWKSKYFSNIADINDIKTKESLVDLNKLFGFKEEYNCGSTEEKGDFYFSLGRWSLASMEKSIGQFKFGLKDYGFNLKGNKAELSFTGMIGICDVLEADCGLSISAEVNISSFSFSFGGVEFKKASLKTQFAGIVVKGVLEASSGDDEGYSGELEITLPGDIFELKANGGFYTCTGKDAENNDIKYSWGYFTAVIKSSAGIRIDPIVISGISGGFYFNCKPNPDAETEPTREKGQIGFMLGMVICTTAGEKTLKADMDLTVVFDTENKRLSAFIMNGTLDALGGMVNARAQLLYQDSDTSRLFNLNITANGGKELDSQIAKKFEAFAGKAMEEGMAIQQGLESLTADEQKDESTKTKPEESKDDEEKKSEEFTAKCGFSVSLDFRIETFKQGEKKGKTKWHLYIGQPPYAKRCQLTLIDFQVGKRDDAFAAWAYLGANMYFCLGNELPNNGALPDLPQKAKDYLDGKDVNGNDQGLTGTAQSNSEQQIQAMLTQVNSKGCEGGLMVGACAEGDFGVNAGIVYAHAYACLGFDVMLKKLTPGTKCRGGGEMGYKDWYGMGQAYLVMLGDLGVHIDLWFIKKDIPIIEVGLGALLQAGLPNPTWCYGKARASLSLLGGIFKFNRSIEFKAGDVCKPDYGDPLANIQIVADAQPGTTERKSTEDEIASVYSKPRFTTNFVIGKEVTLVDQNKQADAMEKNNVSEEKAATMAARYYRFKINSVTMYRYAKSRFGRGGSYTKFADCTWEKADEGTNFNVTCRSFDPNTTYYMEIVAEAEEFNSSTAKWGNPIIDGEPTPKIETTRYYFTTGSLGEDISQDIEYSLPMKGTWDEVRAVDFKQPYLCLNHFRSDLAAAGVDTDTPSGSKDVEYGYRWVLYRNGERYAVQPNYVERSGDYETWRPQNAFTGIYYLDNHKLSLVKYVKGASKANTLATEKVKSITKSELVNDNGTYTATYSKKGPYEENYALKMKQFFNNEEREEKADRNVTTTQNAGYKDEVAIAAQETEIYSISAKKLVSGKFSSSDKFYDYEEVYMAPWFFWNNFEQSYLDEQGYGLSCLVDGSWSWTPYTQMIYFANYAFPGGLYHGKYAYSNVAQTEKGCSVELKYPELRAYDSFINGIIDGGRNLYCFQDYWPYKSKDGYGYWRDADLDTQYSNDGYKVDNADIKFTSLHKAELMALASDAYTAEEMTTSLSSNSTWAYNYIKRLRNYNKEKTFISGMKTQNDETYYLSKSTSTSTQHTLKSNNEKTDPTLKFETGSYSVPYRHFWQMANMAGDPISSIKTVSNITNFKTRFPYRYNHPMQVWADVTNAKFTAKDYLKAYKHIMYVLWRTDRYNIKKGRKEMYDTKSNLKYHTVWWPFQNYKF